MKIVVCGLGYVGSVTAACLLRAGHSVVGVDPNEQARDLLAKGKSPIREPDVGRLIAAGHAAGLLTVAADLADHADADMVIGCVGTPSHADGTLDLSAVNSAAQSIGAMLRLRDRRRETMLVVCRSTMLPRSMTGTVLPAIARTCGEPPGALYEVVYNPEFTRLGSAVADYFAPARIIIGERVPGTARALLELYAGIDAPVFMTTFEAAELAKYADNAFHALKVAYANEIGRAALRSGIRPTDVFELFLADRKLNLSASYLLPGGAFGGPCLPKDLRALEAHMRDIGIAAPVVGHILKSNEEHAAFLVSEIERRLERKASPARILLVGLSFKTGSGELRESPLVNLAEALIDRGHRLSVYDPDITGVNGNASDRVIATLPPRLSSIILTSLPAEPAWDLVVVGKSCPLAAATLEASPVFRVDRL